MLKKKKNTFLSKLRYCLQKEPLSIDQKKTHFSLWDAGTLRKKGILELQGTAAQGIDSSSNRLEWQVQLARNWERHAVLFAEKGSILTLTHCGDKLDLLQINKQRLEIGYIQKMLERQ